MSSRSSQRGPLRWSPLFWLAALCAVVVLFVFAGKLLTPAGPPMPRLAAPGKFVFAANLPWLEYGQDFGAVTAWHSKKGVASPASEKLAGKQLWELSNGGVEAVVWFLLADGRAAPKLDRDGFPQELDDVFWKDYDAALEAARIHHVGIVWVLLDYKWFLPGATVNGAELFGRADVINDPRKRTRFIDEVITPLVSRHPDHPNILGWILLNEADLALRPSCTGANSRKAPCVSPEALRTFAIEARDVIHGKAAGQPVSIDFSTFEDFVQNAALARELDFLVVHHYASNLPPPAGYLKHALGLPPAMPLYIGEFDSTVPPNARTRLVRWSRTLGFDGIWPWSVNALHGEDATRVGGGLENVLDSRRVVPRPNDALTPEDFARRWAQDGDATRANRDLQEWLAGGRRLVDAIGEDQRRTSRTLDDDRRALAQAALANDTSEYDRLIETVSDNERAQLLAELYLGFWTTELAQATRFGLTPTTKPVSNGQ